MHFQHSAFQADDLTSQEADPYIGDDIFAESWATDSSAAPTIRWNKHGVLPFLFDC